MLNAIYQERRVKLAMEGVRFFDLIRTNRAESILGPLGFVKGKHELMPIPVNEIIITDRVLVQNPQYN